MKITSVSIESIWYKDNLDFFTPALNQPGDLIVCTLLKESTPIAQWKHRLTELIRRAKSAGKTVVLIINSWYKKDREILVNAGVDEIVFLDFFLLLVYIRLINDHESVVRERWHSNSEKWLFLTGKADKPNRLPLLYKFYQEELLDRCQWSLFVADQQREQCKRRLTDLNDAEADRWLERFSGSPDNAEVEINSTGTTHYSGIPYGDIYQSCLFQLISESSVDQSEPWLTEKTWLPIINRTPFLIFGDPTSNQKLNSMGFLTFDEFLLDTDFDKPLELNIRVDSVVKNIRHWLVNLSTQSAEIESMIEHNHLRFMDLAAKNIKLLEEICLKYSMKIDIDQLVDFRHRSQYSKWKNWYLHIKDPSWPMCDREQDFHKLPERIQKECIEVFGYQPKERS